MGENSQIAAYDYALAVLSRSGAKKAKPSGKYRHCPCRCGELRKRGRMSGTGQMAARHVVCDEGHKIKTHNIAARRR
jgi:hypothetical protein